MAVSFNDATTNKKFYSDYFCEGTLQTLLKFLGFSLVAIDNVVHSAEDGAVSFPGKNPRLHN
jgi:hypothetical protein